MNLDEEREEDAPTDVQSTGNDLPETAESVQTVASELTSTGTTTISHATSETESAPSATPPSIVQPLASSARIYSRQPNKVLPIVPVVPNIPSLARSVKKQAQSVTESVPDDDTAAKETPPPAITAADAASEEPKAEERPPPKPAPKSWADLVRTKAPAINQSQSNLNGAVVGQGNGLNVPKGSPLPDVLSSFTGRTKESDTKIPFLKPRGLINTGNMCYMNSVSPDPSSSLGRALTFYRFCKYSFSAYHSLIF